VILSPLHVSVPSTAQQESKLVWIPDGYGLGSRLGQNTLFLDFGTNKEVDL